MYKIFLAVLFLIPLTQITVAEEIPDYDKPYAPIYFNQPSYSWTEKVEITIIAPSWNTEVNLIDSIGGDPNHAIDIYTNNHRLEEYKLYETDPASGIFTGEIILTGFSHDVDGDGESDTNPRTTGIGPNGGYLQVDEDSGITVSFEFADGVVLTESTNIEWNKGHLKFSEITDEFVIVKLYDRDMNLNPEAVDLVAIKVFSDIDSAGVSVQAAETSADSGVFEVKVEFTKIDNSSGSRLLAFPDSVITAEYSDRTLPNPYSKSDDLDVFASAQVVSSVPHLERLVVDATDILSLSGKTIEKPKAGQGLMIFSEIQNTFDFPRDFVYIVQVKDEQNNVVSLSWISGQIIAFQDLGVSVSWTPNESAIYTIERFVWNSIQDASPLSDVELEKILVE